MFHCVLTVNSNYFLIKHLLIALSLSLSLSLMDAICVLCDANSEYFASKKSSKEECEAVNDDNMSVWKVIAEFFVYRNT
jgi:hypothetical protein